MFELSSLYEESLDRNLVRLYFIFVLNAVFSFSAAVLCVVTSLYAIFAVVFRVFSINVFTKTYGIFKAYYKLCALIL